MKKETFIAILKEESIILTEKEIWEIIDEELDKDPDEMDADLVDLCLDALDGKFDDEEVEQLNRSKKRLKLGRVLLIAAVIVFVFGLSIPVCANHLSINTPKGVVNYIQSCFELNMGSSDKSIDVLSQLENKSINAVIPNELLKSEYVFENFRAYDNSDYLKTYAVDFKNNDLSGAITINSYGKDYDFASGKNLADNEYEIFEQISKDGKDILVFGDDETSNIYYVIDNVEYIIVLDSDYSTAYNIAETL